MRELELIEKIRKRAGRPGKGVKLGIGDDCAVLEHTKREYLLWAADMLVSGTHFRTGDTEYAKIGRKAVAVNISDIAAMGGLPKYVTVSIGVPRGMARTAVDKIYDGIFGICREYGVKVIGGDTVRSGKLVIDVSILGIVEKERLLTRSGAEKGDLILVTGPVRNGKKEHLDFIPRLVEARFLSENYRINAMIDTSDGIAPDIGRICSLSRAGCVLYADAIPLSKGLSLREALYYGESFELLFTMGVKEARRLFRDMKPRAKALEYFVIGEITGRKNERVLIEKEARLSKLKMEGYRHV